MTDTAASLLLVDGDGGFARLFCDEADERGYRARAVPSVPEAARLVQEESFDAILVDFAPGAESAFELLARIRQLQSDTEILVMSDRSSAAANIQWFDPDAFTFVRKSDMSQLFASLGLALHRRRITAQNRRLVWELQTINEITAGLTRSLERDEVLTGALQRLVRAMDAAGGSIRLRNETTGVFETSAEIDSSSCRRFARQQWGSIPRPSNQVIATRAAVIVEDFTDLAADAPNAIPLRSAISLPMFAGTQVIGTLSLGSTRPRRFTAEDQTFLTIVVAQIVVAVQNAQLHHTIRRAKREWEQTFDAISDPIAVYNSRGTLLRGNRALAEHLGMPVTGMRHLTCSETHFCGGSEGCADCAVTRALSHEKSRGEVTLPDGQIFSVMTFPIGLPSEGPSVVQIAKNVTEEIRSARRLQQMSDELQGTNARLVSALAQLKSTQAQLVQAEKLSAIGQLVAGVAHELNNPLTSVIGYAQLLEEELQGDVTARPPDEVAQDLRRIAEESERAARIVRNLLSFARRQSAERAPQNLIEVCQRVLALRQYEFRMSSIELETDFPDSVAPVLADAGQLQQVLLNLVLNAEHAMRGGQTRRLVVSVSEDEASGAVELAVSDSGHGIDPANLPRIFDPFFTTREVGEGTGLGLSICYGIVRGHGGHIRVESAPGTGTTFRLLLPAHRHQAAAAPEVLVAHAGQSEREFVSAMLAGWGYRPVPAATLREALRAYRRPSLHMAILDRGLLMEDLAAWRRTRGESPDRPLPLVLTSTTADDVTVQQFAREQGAAVLVPPIQLRALHEAIRVGEKECV